MRSNDVSGGPLVEPFNTASCCRKGRYSRICFFGILRIERRVGTAPWSKKVLVGKGDRIVRNNEVFECGIITERHRIPSNAQAKWRVVFSPLGRAHGWLGVTTQLRAWQPEGVCDLARRATGHTAFAG